MNSLQKIKAQIDEYAQQFGRNKDDIKLLAVSKNQPVEKIKRLLEHGHRLFGENRVQEAYAKWLVLKEYYANIELHLIGHLQTNKVKEAVALFKVIQTLDSFKLAEKLVVEEQRQKKRLSYYIEINIGCEKQKTGILPDEFPLFFNELKNNYPLDIQGIMCIPPKEEDPVKYFQQMKKIADDYQLPVISMGMSDDYPIAIKYGTTMVRIGTALFGHSRISL